MKKIILISLMLLCFIGNAPTISNAVSLEELADIARRVDRLGIERLSDKDLMNFYWEASMNRSMNEAIEGDDPPGRLTTYYRMQELKALDEIERRGLMKKKEIKALRERAKYKSKQSKNK